MLKVDILIARALLVNQLEAIYTGDTLSIFCKRTELKAARAVLVNIRETLPKKKENEKAAALAAYDQLVIACYIIGSETNAGDAFLAIKRAITAIRMWDTYLG